jgi:hypothetical protein
MRLSYGRSVARLLDILISAILRRRPSTSVWDERRREIMHPTDRNVSIGAVYATIERLTTKGF